MYNGILYNNMSLLLNVSLRSQLSYRPTISNIFKNYSSVRGFSSKTLSSVKIKSDQESIQTFKEIYRFRYIKIAYAINKIKWPQTLLTALTLPTSAALCFGGILDVDMLIGIIISTVIITGNLYAYGSMFHKAVGFIYLSEDGLTLKIAYLGFWGARVDKEVPVDDIVPLADCPRSPTDYVYRTIHFYSTDKLQPKLFLKAGRQVTDVNKFTRVFGDHTKY